jgi:hypothetical protein
LSAGLQNTGGRLQAVKALAIRGRETWMV